jgi:hypothetical protein
VAEKPDIAQQKEDWLREHLPYQVMMMRHTYKQLFNHSLSTLDWNAMYMAFANAARNLRLFLTNGDKGKNNFGAHEFVALDFIATRSGLQIP